MFDFLIHFTVKAHHMVMKYEETVVFLSLLALSPLLYGYLFSCRTHCFTFQRKKNDLGDM